MSKKLNFLFRFSVVAIILSLAFMFILPDKTIKIGFLADLSSRKSQLGIVARNGVIMAVDELNSNGGIDGRNVELIIRDHKGKKEDCSKEVSYLVNQGVEVIIGPLVSGMASTVIQGTREKKTLIISPTVSTDELSGLDDHFLRVIAPASDQGRNLAVAALANKNKKIAIVLDQNNIAYTLAVANGFKEKIKETPGVIVNEVLFQNKSDIVKTAQEIKKAEPDAIVIAASGIDASAIIQQYAKTLPVPDLYGSMWSKISKINEYGGSTVEGMILVDAFENATPTLKEKQFVRNYKERFNTHPNFAARYAYESVYLFANGAKAASTINGKTIKKQILKMNPIHGLTDDYHMDKYGDAVRKQSLYIIKNNKYELYSVPE